MFQIGDSPAANLALDVTLARLTAHPLVDGLLVMGSAGAAAGKVGPASDYDVLVVLRELRVPLRLVLTLVDHRLTEIYVASSATLEHLAEGTALPDGAEDLRPAMTTWIQTGRIAFDRSGRLEHVRKVLTDRASFVPATDAELYGRWAHTNYNVRQTKRMAAADDTAYQTAVDLRLLYGLDDLKLDYFAVRRLPFRGEKEAVHYWSEHDPAYLRLFQAVIAETNRGRKVALYCQLAALTLAPVGGLMPEDATSVTLEPGTEDVAAAVAEALDLWRALVAGEPSLRRPPEPDVPLEPGETNR